MRCLRSLLVAVSPLLLSSALMGQIPESTPRIHGPVDERSLVVLSGNVPGPARAEFDRGEAPASTELAHVRLILARSSEQQAALDKYDAELLDRSSPNYHKWLTPEQFGKLYGLADSDIAAIIAWLQSHGLQVDALEPGRTNISFSGTVSQIEELLHISIHSFERNGEQFFSNTTNPRIPAALAPVISGVARLNTLKPKPHHVMGRMGVFDPDTGRMTPVPGAAPGPRPNLTTGSGTSSTLFLVPGDAATIYDTPNSFNANPPSGTTYKGTGVTIGVGGDATVNASTVVDYRTRFLGDTTSPTISYCGDFVNPPSTPACSSSSTGLGIGTSDQGEAYLDIEISGGLAPGATIHYYASSDLYGAIEAAINQNAVDIFSLSFGACELDMTNSDNALLNSWWQQAATQGMAVTVSTGDNGSAACDNNNTETVATGGLKVSGFASTPYNVAVGGTDFGPLLNSFSTYVSPSTSNSSATFYRTALKYIPEWTWNDSTTVNTTISANVPYIDPTSMQGNIVAGSGGKSTCSTNTTTYDNMGNETRGTCTSGYAKPSWQRGSGVPSDNARFLPDISLMAGAGGDAAAWLICTDDTGQNGSGATVTANCTTQSDNHFYFGGVGGTSTSAPAFAGILALVQQKTGSRLGQAAKELYDLYNSTHASAIFHDVTTGNISVPCASTPTVSTDCAKNGVGNYFLSGYNTGAGYDLATGIGSVDVNQLITYWGTVTGSATATVTVAPSSSTINRNNPLTVPVTVKGSATTGNPTGTVTLSGGGYTSSAQTLTASGADSAVYTFNIPGNSFNKGSNTLSVSYSGDANYAVATGTAPLTVNALTASVAVSPASSNLNSGVALNVTATVTGTGGTPTGTVTLTGGTYNSGAKTLDNAGKFVFTIPAFTFTTAGAVTLTVHYSGDATYNSATNTANINVAVSKFTLSATDVTLTAGATSGNVSQISVSPVAGYLGSVTLTAAVTSSPSGAVSTPTLTVGGSPANIQSASPVAATVTVGTTAATAVRTGGGNAWLRAAGGTALAAFLLFFLPLGSRRGRRILSVLLVLAAATFTAVGCGGGGHTMTTPTVTVTPSKTTFSADTAITVTVSVSGGSSTPTGSVTLTGGGFNASSTSLSGGSATINIPANSLSAGSVTLTANYSGDTNFNSASGSATVTVNKPATTKGAYIVTVTGKGNDAAATTTTTTFHLTVN